MTAFLAEHGEIVATVVAALWALVLLMAAEGLRTLRAEVKLTREQGVSSATKLEAAIDKVSGEQARLWEAHEEEHRDFQHQLIGLDGRLSHLEGEHEQLARRHRTTREASTNDEQG